MFELLLLSVVVSTAYLGPMILKRFGPHQRVYGLMLVSTLVLALVAFVDRSLNGPTSTSSTVGAVAIGSAFFLIMAPAMIRDLGRRFLRKDRLRLAKVLAELRELLQPGMGAASEIELIETILAVREGNEQVIVDALKARKAGAEDPNSRRVLDERVVMTYLYAQRWSAAIEDYERMHGRHDRPGPPQLVVEMVRAYCENADLEEAALLMTRIEDSPLAREPVVATLVARARMVFLAFLGRTGAVEAMVGPDGPLSKMPPAARNYWSGIARLNAGDGVGARTSLSEAVRLTRDDPRASKLAQAHLDRLDEPGQLGPHAVPLQVAEVADRLTFSASETDSLPEPHIGRASRGVPRLTSVPFRVMPVTVVISIVNILASAAVYAHFGNITDLGALISVGANLKSATVSGEWWRLASSMFLHVGVAHLVLNVYGLWVLGRLVEQMQGSLRMLAIYAVAGFAGAMASTYLGGAATAVCASGAVVGLMGAAVAELGVFRSHYPKAWSRPLFGMLALLSLAQLAVGFFYPIVDQWGQVGGFVGGGIASLLVSPSGALLRKVRTALAAVVVTATLSALAYTALAVATSSYTQTLRGYRQVEQTIGGLVIIVPEPWAKVSHRELYDPGVGVQLDLRRLPASQGLDASISARLEEEHLGGALRAGFDRAEPAARTHLDLPESWRGGELAVSVDNGASGAQHFRLAIFGRVHGDEIWLGAFYHPAALTKAIEPVLLRALASLRPE
ncbi:MAG: rhomboid family intramembrane serine protease [Myxococcales bacterium]|nr:rhomboid family intramembrane serine protease [Myxococcales bacterium]